jgi:hypothetical protein
LFKFELIKWRFLSRDKNDDLTEVWLEDEEPNSCVIDSWAKGYMQTEYNEIDNNQNNNNEIDEVDEELLFENDETATATTTTPSQNDNSSSPQQPQPLKLDPHQKASLKLKKKKKPPVKKEISSTDNYDIPNEMMLEQLEINDDYDDDNTNFFMKQSVLNRRRKISKNLTDNSETKQIEESISKAPIATQSMLKVKNNFKISIFNS